MGLHYVNLDDTTRRFMVQEVERDIGGGELYLSPRLTDNGAARWPELLKEACQAHDDNWLAELLRSARLMRTKEQRRKPKGGYTTAQVPVTAPDTLAEGEFNRFYARGLCLRANQEGIAEVEVYRGKAVAQPRPESEQMIGKRVSAAALLADLRVSQGASQRWASRRVRTRASR